MSSQEYCAKAANKQWLIKIVVLKSGLTYGISFLVFFYFFLTKAHIVPISSLVPCRLYNAHLILCLSTTGSLNTHFYKSIVAVSDSKKLLKIKPS